MFRIHSKQITYKNLQNNTYKEGYENINNCENYKMDSKKYFYNNYNKHKNDKEIKQMGEKCFFVLISMKSTIEKLDRQ